MDQIFKGAGVALVTPFKTDFSVDYEALGNIVENQAVGGMDYLVALGTTAETATLTESEKNDVVRFIIKKSAGRMPVMVGMGGNNTQAVIDSIKSADLEGVAGLLIVTPYYNKPTQEGLYSHFMAVAEMSPLPIVLYNVPSRTGINMEAETVIKLANDSEKIVGIKEASGILSQLTLIEKYTPAGFSLISGDDVLALPIAAIGGVGVISVLANALPAPVCSMIHKALEGDYNGARELHHQLIDMFKLIFKENNPGGVKALMQIQGTLKNVLRLPLCPVSAAHYKELEKALKNM